MVDLHTPQLAAIDVHLVVCVLGEVHNVANSETFFL
jgi:hypothetical protein